jgi:TolA-binding protein
MENMRSAYFLMSLLLLPIVGACVTTRHELIRQRETQDIDRPAPRGEPLRSARKPAPPETGSAAGAPTPPAAPSAAPVPTTGAAVAPAAAVATEVPTPLPQPTATPEPPKDLTTLSDDELRAELAKTIGRNEELQHELELKNQSKSEEMKKAEERIAALEKQLKELTPEAPKVPEGKSPFEAGKDSHAAGRWDEAIAFFNQTLEVSEKGKVAEEAIYLRGDCYFKKLQYNKAIVEFSKFPERFQKSPYHSKALLKIAESFESMGRKEDARMFYAELLEKFPKTAEGKIAKKKTKK